MSSVTTEKNLAPFIKIKSSEINYLSPPSWRSLVRWIKVFVESGWEKASLIQRNKDKGSSISKLDPELSTLIDNVIKSHRKKPNIKYQKIYNEVAEKLKEINIERVKHSKDELVCCSYQAIMKKVKKRR